MTEKTLSLAQKLKEILTEKNLKISTAESCTGGLVGRAIISVSGSSEYFKGGIIAYSNQIKQEILKVPKPILEKYGAVSKQTVEIMAKQASELFKTEISIATSGIAGPTGGTKEKPVGTIWIAIKIKEKIISFLFQSKNQDRNQNINIFAEKALEKLIISLEENL